MILDLIQMLAALLTGAGASAGVIKVIYWYRTKNSILEKKYNTNQQGLLIQGWSDLVARMRTEINDLANRITKEEDERRDCQDRLNAEEEKTDIAIRKINDLTRQIEQLQLATISASIVVDESGCIVEWSAGASTIFHYEAAEVIGKNMDFLTPHRYRSKHWASFQMARNSGKLARSGESIIVYGLTREGAEIPLSISLSLWVTSDGSKRFGAEVKRMI